MKRNSALFLILAIALLAACKPTSSPEVTVGGAGRVVIDDLGKKVVLPMDVRRAVSLAPNLTEIVYAVGAGDRLVGVTSFCDFPAEAKNVRKVGDTLKPNVETILALKPDVVFVTTASQLETFTQTLNDQKIAVFVTDPNSLEGIYRSIEKIGEVFDTDRSSKLVEDMKRRVDEIAKRTETSPKPSVFVQIDRSLFTIGRESYLTDLVTRAGGSSATADLEKAYAQLSRERALALDPEVIILSESSDNTEPADVFLNSRAVKAGRVAKINADVMSRPGPRVVEALEQIAKALHPEIFAK